MGVFYIVQKSAPFTNQYGGVTILSNGALFLFLIFLFFSCYDYHSYSSDIISSGALYGDDFISPIFYSGDLTDGGITNLNFGSPHTTNQTPIYFSFH